MVQNEDQTLIKAALEAREYANATLSGFKVGAALLTACGKIYTGCNIEDPSGIGITNICAERCAIIKAVSEGIKEFTKIAVVGGEDELIQCLPCGACRQYLNSFCPNIEVITSESDEIKEYKLTELLPYAFNI